MKRSTRLIIIALIAAAVTMTAKCIYDILTAFRFPDYEISDANPVTIELQRFNRIDIVTLQPKPEINLTPRIYKGVVIEESDSVTTPVMKTSLEWSRIITPEIKDSVLTLSFDFCVSSWPEHVQVPIACLVLEGPGHLDYDGAKGRGWKH